MTWREFWAKLSQLAPVFLMPRTQDQLRAMLHEAYRAGYSAGQTEAGRMRVENGWTAWSAERAMATGQ